MLTSLGFIALAIGSACVGVANALWGPRANARRRLKRGTATIADRQIVTVSGTVRAAGKLLEGPATGKRCVVYETLGRVKKYDGQRRLQAVAEIRERNIIPFELETGSEVILVDGTEVDLELEPIPVIPRRIEREAAILDAAGQPRELLRTSNFEEVVIEPGDRITVQGMAVVELETGGATERAIASERGRAGRGSLQFSCGGSVANHLRRRRPLRARPAGFDLRRCRGWQRGHPR